MARRVFFSFHYKRDAWRASQVRNSNVVEKDDRFGFVDAADWESIEREGEDAIKRWIRGQLKQTSVTVVLIGAETSERDWVEFEIRESWERGNALLGIHIHGIKDQDQKTDTAGANPFEGILLKDGIKLSSIVKVHDWALSNGREKFGSWVEAAFKDRENYAGETVLKKADEAVGRAYPTATSAPSVISNPSKPWAR